MRPEGLTIGPTPFQIHDDDDDDADDDKQNVLCASCLRERNSSVIGITNE